MMGDLKFIGEFVSSKQKRRIAADIIEKYPEMKEQFKKARIAIQESENLSEYNTQHVIETYFEDLLKALKDPFVVPDYISNIKLPREMESNPMIELEIIKSIPSDNYGQGIIGLIRHLRKARFSISLKNYFKFNVTEKIKIIMDMGTSKTYKYSVLFELFNTIPQILFLANKKYNAQFYMRFGRRIINHFRELPVETRHFISYTRFPEILAETIPEKLEDNIFAWDTPEVTEKINKIFADFAAQKEKKRQNIKKRKLFM